MKFDGGVLALCQVWSTAGQARGFFDWDDIHYRVSFRSAFDVGRLGLRGLLGKQLVVAARLRLKVGCLLKGAD